MDIQLLNRWFNLGFSSKEMAWFLLLAEMQDPENHQTTWTPEQTQQRWTEIHEQACKLIFAK